MTARVAACRELCMKTRVVLVLFLLCAAGCGSSPTEPSHESCSYTVTPLIFTPCMSRWQGTATVVTGPGCAWTATASASWIAIDGSATRSGSGTFTFAVGDNYAAPRESSIQVRWPGTADGQAIRIAQAGCLYAVIPASTVVQASGADGSFDVYQMAQPYECGGPTQDRCAWTARADVPWITILSSTGSGDGRVNFRVAGNDGSLSRTGTITVQDKLFQITQAGR